MNKCVIFTNSYELIYPTGIKYDNYIALAFGPFGGIAYSARAGVTETVCGDSSGQPILQNVFTSWSSCGCSTR